MCVSRLCRFSCEYTTCSSAVIVRTCDCAIAISLLELLPITLPSVVLRSSFHSFRVFHPFFLFSIDFSTNSGVVWAPGAAMS